MKKSFPLLFTFMLTSLVACVDHALDPAPTPVAAWRAGDFFSDFSNSIATDRDSNVYITGRYEGPVTFGTTSLRSRGRDDIFVVKYNRQGVVQWVQGAGSPRGDAGTSLAVDAQGNVFVMGYFSGLIGFGSGTPTLFPRTAPFSDFPLSDIFVVKFDPDGKALWARQAGGVGIDNGSGLAVDGSGNVYVAVSFEGTASFGNSTLTSTNAVDHFVLKYNTDGVEQWAKKTTGFYVSSGNGLAADGYGNVYMAGSFASVANLDGQSITSSGEGDAFLGKIDKEGTLQWLRRVGGNLGDGANGVAADGAGNVSITGSFQGAADVGGTTLTSKGASDLFVATFDAAGTLKWATGLGGVNSDYGASVEFGTGGNLYLGGVFKESVTIGTQTFTTNTNNDVLLVKFGPDGTVLWARQDGGPNHETIKDISPAPTGDLYITGDFIQNILLAGTSLTSAGGSDLFVARYKE